MKSLLYLVGGAGIALAYFLARKQQAAPMPQPVEELAHRLQDAWADHHTVV
jgi:hypothetical protein